MNGRAREHYEIASRFGGREFTRSEFRRLYGRVHPERPLTSMIPTDYCVNKPEKGTENYPKFLRWISDGRYQMIEGAPAP